MEYKIITLNLDETTKVINESLSEQDYTKITADIKILQACMLCKDYHAIVKDNIQQLLRFLESMDVTDKSNFATINRYTYNVLGVFYAWIEYFESNYKELFTPVKCKFYDNYFEYRMMYNLRTYITHCEMAVTQIDLHFDKRNVFIYIEPIKLLEHKDMLQKKMVSELEQMLKENRKIELDVLMIEFEKVFSAMHSELLKKVKKDAYNIIQEMTEYIQFDPRKSLDCSICQKNDDKYVLSITSFMRLFENKMRNVD